MVVHHICNNPPCCRMDHLEARTNEDNLIEAMLAGLTPRGESHHAAKLTDAKVAEIRRRHTLGEGRRTLAREFGVDQSTIRQVVKRWTWRHVE
jgi:hypothetical protein